MHHTIIAFICAGVIVMAGQSSDAIQKQASDSGTETKADAGLMIHKDGSMTVTVDGERHEIPADRFRERSAELLSGKKHIRVQMEDWRGFEAAGQQLSDLYRLGVRRMTLDIDYEGQKETRTLALRPPTLDRQILTGNLDERDAALDKIDEMLRSEAAGDRISAMTALRKARKARFDGRRFLPMVRRSLGAQGNREVAAALGAIGIVGGNASDLAKVASLVESDAPSVRVWISTTLYELDPKGTRPETGPVIEMLLRDKNNIVRTATYKSLWGKPTTREVDARLIDLSRREMKGGSGEGYNSVYYALSTRPLMRRPVAERLIELIGPTSLLNGRAVWGISHHPADDEAHPIVVDALIRVVDTEADVETRHSAIRGLGLHGGEKAVQKLREIVDDENEPEGTRDCAREQLARLISVSALYLPGAFWAAPTV